MVGDERAHSYHTCFVLTFLQKCSTISSSIFSWTGSRSGKRIGNQENMPGEWVAGRILIMISLYSLHSK